MHPLREQHPPLGVGCPITGTFLDGCLKMGLPGQARTTCYWGLLLALRLLHPSVAHRPYSVDVSSAQAPT